MPTISDVFGNIILPPIVSVFDWFVQLTTPNNWYGLILGLIFFAMVARLLIAPLFGGRLSLGSDKVQGSEGDFVNTDEVHGIDRHGREF